MMLTEIIRRIFDLGQKDRNFLTIFSFDFSGKNRRGYLLFTQMTFRVAAHLANMTAFTRMYTLAEGLRFGLINFPFNLRNSNPCHMNWNIWLIF